MSKKDRIEKEMKLAFADFTGEPYPYALRLAQGCFAGDDRPVIRPENGKITVYFDE